MIQQLHAQLLMIEWLNKGKIYDCIGEEHGEYRIIDEEGYDEDEEVQGYLYPKHFFVEVDDD